MVGVKGLEPSTSASQTPRASQLRHTPSSNLLHKLRLSSPKCNKQNIESGLFHRKEMQTLWRARRDSNPRHAA